MKTLTKYLKEKQAAKETIVVPYIMAGAQGLDQLGSEIALLEEAGASVIELGIPFSDPVADGPTIQAAGLRALENNVNLSSILSELQKINNDVPLVIMSYFNPIFVYGLTKFVEELKQTNVKGLIIPDLPYEHRTLLLPLLEEQDIALIQLIALTTPPERMKKIIQAGEGFIYAVTVNGVTGAGSAYQESLDAHLAYLQKISPLPVLAGFGISLKEHAERFSRHCSGVVVGSKVVELLANQERKALANFIQELVSV